MNGTFWLLRYAIVVVLVAEWLVQQPPRAHGLAYTAPVNDEVTQPVAAPYAAACVYSSTQCRCYSQQGARLEVPADLCKPIADGGLFESGREPVPQAVARATP